MIGWVAFVGYIGTIFGANWAVAHFGFVTVAPGLQAPAGVYFVGLALVLRDVIQWTLGRRVSVLAIPIGAGLSWFVAPSLAVASGVAFLLSETADYLVFTRLAERGWNRALAASTVVGSFVDSGVFLWIAFGSLAFFWGQVVGKLTMVALAVAVSPMVRAKLNPRPVAKS